MKPKHSNIKIYQVLVRLALLRRRAEPKVREKKSHLIGLFVIKNILIKAHFNFNLMNQLNKCETIKTLSN